MTATLVIDRKLSLPYGVLGVMYVEYSANGTRKHDLLGEMFSVERAWHDNELGKSCIPPGNYGLKRETQGRNFAKFKARWGHKFLIELLDVPGRSQIQVHPVSHSQQLLGCIAPVRQPRIGVPKMAGKAAHPKEIYKADGVKMVKTIAGGGNSREAYCHLYKAVVKYNIGWVEVRGHVA